LVSSKLMGGTASANTVIATDINIDGRDYKGKRIGSVLDQLQTDSQNASLKDAGLPTWIQVVHKKHGASGHFCERWTNETDVQQIAHVVHSIFPWMPAEDATGLAKNLKTNVVAGKVVPVTFAAKFFFAEQGSVSMFGTVACDAGSQTVFGGFAHFTTKLETVGLEHDDGEHHLSELDAFLEDNKERLSEADVLHLVSSNMFETVHNFSSVNGDVYKFEWSKLKVKIWGELKKSTKTVTLSVSIAGFTVLNKHVAQLPYHYEITKYFITVGMALTMDAQGLKIVLSITVPIVGKKNFDFYLVKF